MEYAFQEIEQRWKQYWKENNIYKVSNTSDKPKYYVLDMFPYPSGAGLHVGHPLGYIASDILSRYKRLKGYNVLHPMGFDAFGLPAEQYAMETGQHPTVTTEKNIQRYKEQLDNIGFCYDWDREVRTSDAGYYKWTQWIFLQLFHSWYDKAAKKARPIDELIAIFEKEGNNNTPCPDDDKVCFDARGWKSYTAAEKREKLMQYRLAYLSYAEVWWCEGLGTVLANDEVVNGVSERGSFPVERKQMRQWFLRITDYAERLLEGLDNLDWTDAMKEMQRNWIGKSTGAEVKFSLDLSPTLSQGEGGVIAASAINNTATPKWNTAEPTLYNSIKDFRQDLKNNTTEAETILWQLLRNDQLSVKFRRQHVIGRYIADFACLPKSLVIEVDGKIHEQQQEEDALRTAYLEEKGFKVIRFSNEHIIAKPLEVIDIIKDELSKIPDLDKSGHNNTISTAQVPSLGGDLGEVSVSVFTTRPDTLFGVDFMVLAPEHELVGSITTAEQKEAVEKYKEYVKSRSERERLSEVKTVTGAFTGAYVKHPFNHKLIPVWISEYVLAGYGTGAIMAVPAGDDRDHAFAKHFSIPITNIFGLNYTGENAYTDKTGVLDNSDFLNGMESGKAIEVAVRAIEDAGIGRRKVNYKMRDAGFSRQRYWGEPFPIVYVNDVPFGIDEKDLSPTLSKGEGGIIQPRDGETEIQVPSSGAQRAGDLEEINKPAHNDTISKAQVPSLGGDLGEVLPVELPMVEHYKPGPEGQGPLANITDWMNIPGIGTRETNTMPGYAGSSWYFLRYMDPHNDEVFADRKATDYWNQVDVYIGGTEHAVGHLLYSRLWTKVLHDLGKLSFDEPFKKLVNQGMIGAFIKSTYRINYSFKLGAGDVGLVNVNKFIEEYGMHPEEYKPNIPSIFVSKEIADRISNGSMTEEDKVLIDKAEKSILDGREGLPGYLTFSNYNISEIIVEAYLVDNNKLNISAFQEKSRLKNEGNIFLCSTQDFYCGSELGKMGKRYLNSVNPDDIVKEYGADTFRLYEMFLGPLDVSKPWDTKGIEGVHRFLKKLWRLFFDEQKGWLVEETAATDAELRIIHKTIKKVGDDIERFSFNTAVSQFMICVNELTSLNCHKRDVLEALAVIIAPFAPHLAEELWHRFGHESSVLDAFYPAAEEKYLVESTKKYPVAINGKPRTELEFDLAADPAFVEKEVLADETIIKWLEGKTPKKFIYVKGKMINVVV